VRAQLADAVEWSGVQAVGAVRLRLQPDADVLDRAGQDGVGQPGKGARQVVLAIGQLGAAGRLLVAALEGAAGVVEGAELDRDAGADADEGGQGAFVEGGCAFVFEDLRCAVESAAVFCCCLQADFDDIWWWLGI